MGLFAGRDHFDSHFNEVFEAIEVSIQSDPTMQDKIACKVDFRIIYSNHSMCVYQDEISCSNMHIAGCVCVTNATHR